MSKQGVCHVQQGWGETTCILVPWKQGFRYPTRNECMGWFAQISCAVSGVADLDTTKFGTWPKCSVSFWDLINLGTTIVCMLPKEKNC